MHYIMACYGRKTSYFSLEKYLYTHICIIYIYRGTAPSGALDIEKIFMSSIVTATKEARIQLLSA